jgi:hypothetical protein
MSTPGELMAAGIPWGAATQIGQDLSSGLVASGTTKSGALVLVGHQNIFVTVSSGKACSLPPAGGSSIVTIYNGGSNSLAVFTSPNASDTINALSTGASFSVTNGKSAIFVPSKNTWVANLSA